VAGYQYVEVDDDLAANVLYGNNALIHLASDQIPADVAVSIYLSLTPLYAFCRTWPLYFTVHVCSVSRF